MKRKQLLVLLLIVIQVLCLIPVTVYAKEVKLAESEMMNTSINARQDRVDKGLLYLQKNQDDCGIWRKNKQYMAASISNSIEYVASEASDDIQVSVILGNLSEYFNDLDIVNLDDLTQYLLLDKLRENHLVEYFKDIQNIDGGFGLDKGYTSDIIDTKLALKTLEDLNEIEAMSKAARYIIALQNEDGGFGYRLGMKSNPELTAEIADILADCIKRDAVLAEDLFDSINKMDNFLDENMIPIDKLSKDSLTEVYQHFHTVSFKLKMSGKYDVTPYYELQSENGSVFDDPLATALFLEIIVREQNSLISRFDYIQITNDAGYTVSAFNENENVNIEVASEFETEKAVLKITLETPSGENIVIDNNTPVWNTGDSEEGTYTVKAEIIRQSTNESVAEMKQTFRIEHRLSIDTISLGLSQSFARVGDEAKVDISANIGLKNFTEDENNLLIRWNVKLDDEIVKTEEKQITESEIKETTFYLGDFVPDTSARKVYLITAEIVSNEMVLAQSTTNFFISDKGVALLRNVNKDFLYETEDDAEITAKIRDERVVDLIFTTSSDDTEVISRYADRIEKIKAELENLGYIVNICSVSTSYLSAKDTFAWNEYDHVNYSDYYVANIPKHIIYNEDSISMLGYGYAPMKDFLLVPDTNKSQKILEFDLQRDNSNDWHTLDGGGFLFNTSIENDVLQGYCVLVGRNGLNLIQINGVDINRFRNGSYNTVQSAGRLLQTFNIGNVLDKHHIKLVADNNTLSLWDGDNQLLDNYELPAKDYGNGYGPITSYTSHSCWVRSSFTFSNITMKTIAGEKLADILENYNFESPTSRYVVNLSDTLMDSLDTDEELQEVAQKVLEKNISFIGLGNGTNIEQYQDLIDVIKEQGSYYNFEEEATIDNLSESIINAEEDKRVKVENDIVATDLVFTGILYDGTEYRQEYEKLCSGETIEIKIPVTLTGLISGTDAVLFKNITLTYKDENGIGRTKNVLDVILPVKTPEGKVSNNVITDKPEYKSHQDVMITDRIHNSSKNRTAKGLKNIITVSNAEGEILIQFGKELLEIMSSSYIEHNEIWNTEDMPEGIYTIRSEIFDKDELISESDAQISIIYPEQEDINLEGNLNVSGKVFKAEDAIEINSMIENVGFTDVANANTVITILNCKDENIVYQYKQPLNLNVSEKNSDTFTVKPQIDFSSYKGGEYLVKYEAVLEDGRIISLVGDGFLIDRGLPEIINDNILFSMDTDEEKRGILLNGSIITINSGIHSNTDMESNCSVLEIGGICDTKLEPVLNTVQTNLKQGINNGEVIEIPNILEELRERLEDEDVLYNGGSIEQTDEQLKLYGNTMVISSDIYNDKTILVELSDFSSDKDQGVLLCSDEDIIIHAATVNFKGIIYAPNGTVQIDSSNFNLKGRIIAKNIVYQGSVFNGEKYDGDLDLFE